MIGTICLNINQEHNWNHIASNHCMSTLLTIEIANHFGIVLISTISYYEYILLVMNHFLVMKHHKKEFTNSSDDIVSPLRSCAHWGGHLGPSVFVPEALCHFRSKAQSARMANQESTKPRRCTGG